MITLEGEILVSNEKKAAKVSVFNRILVILIVICFIVLVYSLTYQPTEEEFKPKFPTKGIVNIHEHIQRISDADKWLEAMDICGVSATVMLGSPKETYLLKGTFLFDIDLNYKQSLTEGNIDESLKNVFKNNDQLLSSNAQLLNIDESTWVIIDELKIYNIFDIDNKLKIYDYSPFNNYSENNDAILSMEKKHDSKILAFPTIDPRDPNKLDVLKKQLDKGAVGLKLYSGHTGEIYPGEKKTIYDYLGPLNRMDMYNVYAYCERNKVPIIWHIKLAWDYLYDETREVLKDFPNLIVNIPHFGVLGSNLTRLGLLMDDYTGVYTDISFGGFAYWSMQLASNHIEQYRAFVNKYHDRVMFGTDMVVTNNIRKTVPWIVNLTMGYRDLLEKKVFHINVSNITGEGFDFDMELNGFGLSQDILDEIYFENAIRFLEGKLAPNKMSNTRAISNPRMGHGFITIDASESKIETIICDRLITAAHAAGLKH